MRKIAVTMTHDKTYINLWRKYYSQYFDDLFVYDTTAKSDFVFLRGKSEELVKEFLKTYDTVLFTCDDEFVIPLKGWDFTDDFIICKGYEVIQTKGEPNLNFQKPILQQRKYWAQNSLWNKPTLTHVPLLYAQGWHCLKDEVQGEQEGNPNFLLVHLKRADWNIYSKRYSDKKVFHEFDDKLEEIPEEIKKYL